MTKIAIVTLFGYMNIGNKLQNYAVQELIKSLGYVPETLVCDDFIHRYSINVKERIKLFLGNFIKKYKKYLLDYKRRKVFFDETDGLISRSDFLSWEEIKNKKNDSYSAYVVGSDQVWYNWLQTEGEMEFRFLEFVDEKKRICFSPSFGMDEVPEDEMEIFRVGLNGFTNLSSREISGCKLIEDITGKNAALLCDPTMMISTQKWNDIAQKPKYNVPDKFVLLYFLSKISEEQKKIIEEYAKYNECKIVNIYDIESPAYYNTTPQEFIYLMNKASYVFTNSFHGTVFSILYHRKFTTFSRVLNEVRMNNRSITLLEKFDLLECLNGIKITEYDWNYVEDILKIESDKGIEYLRKEIERAVS